MTIKEPRNVVINNDSLAFVLVRDNRMTIIILIIRRYNTLFLFETDGTLFLQAKVVQPIVALIPHCLLW